MKPTFSIVPIIQNLNMLIEHNDVRGAEKAMELVASMHGDQVLKSVLQELPPNNLVVILREFDASHSSIITHLVTPDQFALALQQEWKHWIGAAGFEDNWRRLSGMITGVVFRPDQNKDETVAFLQEICKQDSGYHMLAFYLAQHVNPVLHFTHYHHFNLNTGENVGDVSSSHFDGEWQQLVQIMDEHCPVEFGEIVTILRTATNSQLSASEKSQLNDGAICDQDIEYSEEDAMISIYDKIRHLGDDATVEAEESFLL